MRKIVYCLPWARTGHVYYELDLVRDLLVGIRENGERNILKNSCGDECREIMCGDAIKQITEDEAFGLLKKEVFPIYFTHGFKDGTKLVYFTNRFVSFLIDSKGVESRAGHSNVLDYAKQNWEQLETKEAEKIWKALILNNLSQKPLEKLIQINE